jgi:excisionase family DNA binding protein
MPSTPGRSNKLSAYISIADAATYLGLTTRTVRQMIADGRLRGYRSGSRIVRLRVDEIDADMQPIVGVL